jgi:hypothetical protein
LFVQTSPFAETSLTPARSLSGPLYGSTIAAAVIFIGREATSARAVAQVLFAAQLC